MTPAEAKAQLHLDLLARGFTVVNLTDFDADFDVCEAASGVDATYAQMLENMNTAYWTMTGQFYSG